MHATIADLERRLRGERAARKAAEARARECERLRVELDEAQEEMRQLREAFAPRLTWPKPWKLAPAESAVLGALMRCRGDYASREALMLATSRPDADEPTDPKVLDVFVHKLRKKLGPLGVEILTVRGVGFALTRESKVALTQILDEQAST